MTKFHKICLCRYLKLCCSIFWLKRVIHPSWKKYQVATWTKLSEVVCIHEKPSGFNFEILEHLRWKVTDDLNSRSNSLLYSTEHLLNFSFFEQKSRITSEIHRNFPKVVQNICKTQRYTFWPSFINIYARKRFLAQIPIFKFASTIFKGKIFLWNSQSQFQNWDLV